MAESACARACFGVPRRGGGGRVKKKCKKKIESKFPAGVVFLGSLIAVKILRI